MPRFSTDQWNVIRNTLADIQALIRFPGFKERFNLIDNKGSNSQWEVIFIDGSYTVESSLYLQASLLNADATLNDTLFIINNPLADSADQPVLTPTPSQGSEAKYLAGINAIYTAQNENFYMVITRIGENKGYLLEILQRIHDTRTELKEVRQDVKKIINGEVELGCLTTEQFYLSLTTILDLIGVPSGKLYLYLVDEFRKLNENIDLEARGIRDFIALENVGLLADITTLLDNTGNNFQQCCDEIESYFEQVKDDNDTIKNNINEVYEQLNNVFTELNNDNETIKSQINQVYERTTTLNNNNTQLENYINNKFLDLTLRMELTNLAIASLNTNVNTTRQDLIERITNIQNQNELRYLDIVQRLIAIDSQVS